MQSLTNTSLLLGVLLVLVSCVTVQSAKFDPVYLALRDFYDATNGFYWRNKGNWLQNSNYCSWYGVTCYSGVTTIYGLSLASNNLTGEFSDGFDRIGNKVASLDLSNNFITGEVPTELCQWKTLNKLLINGNQFYKLPECIGNLTGLSEFNAGINRFSVIPESIGKLTSLTTLLLNNNQIRYLPQSIVQLKALTTLDLNSNSLTILPSGIGQLRALTDLRLSNNSILELPQDFGELQVNILNLDYNKLQYFPIELTQLKTLRTLYLRFNAMKGSLPKELQQMYDIYSLKSILLTDNQLDTIPRLGTPVLPLTCSFSGNHFKCPIPDWTRVQCSASCQ